jgi:NAD(P)-dependent dehydrogenase (short-subunit alcohol dehydrogenase family)
MVNPNVSNGLGRARATLEFLPDLTGKTIVITGANSGLGYECTRVFAGAGAYVVMGCRSAQRADEAIRRIHAEIPKAEVEFLELDLASLASIRAFADQALKHLRRINILCNNAADNAFRPKISRTRDGFEAHFGINHLGHFALTGLLFDKIQASTPARIVTVTARGRHESAPGINFDDLQCTQHYSAMRAYINSKLANLLFTYELNRRLHTYGIDIKAVSCTPGPTHTNLLKRQPLWVKLFFRPFSQSPINGALSEIYAAVGEDIDGGDYIGRGGNTLMMRFHRLRKLKPSTHACDPEVSNRLWTISEEMTGVRFLD